MTVPDPQDSSIGNRILVVDDEEGMRHMLQAFLTRNGFVVSEAENGKKALERLREGDIDLVLFQPTACNRFTFY